MIAVGATASSLEVKGAASSAAAAHTAKVEAWGHTTPTSEGVAAGAFRRRCTASQQEFESVVVVGFALLGIGENFVGLRAFLELLSSSGIVRVLVGVILEGHFSIEDVSKL